MVVVVRIVVMIAAIAVRIVVLGKNFLPAEKGTFSINFN